MPTMEETRVALAAGATRQDLLAAGHSASSITKAQQQLHRTTRKTTAPRPHPSKNMSIIVRPIQDQDYQIALPRGMFSIYYHMKAKYPMYKATKSEWIQDIVQCWAEERHEEIPDFPRAPRNGDYLWS